MEINNYINAEIIITANNVKKEIPIINSFENFKKENELEDKEDDYKYKNEEEIKKCKILINNIMIPFSCRHTFIKKGKYHIKYLFSENLTKTN